MKTIRTWLQQNTKGLKKGFDKNAFVFSYNDILDLEKVVKMDFEHFETQAKILNKKLNELDSKIKESNKNVLKEINNLIEMFRKKKKADDKIKFQKTLLLNEVFASLKKQGGRFKPEVANILSVIKYLEDNK